MFGIKTAFKQIQITLSEMYRRIDRLESLLIHKTGFGQEETLLDKWINLEDQVDLVSRKIDQMQREKHLKAKKGKK